MSRLDRPEIQFIKGTTQDEKFDSINTALKRISVGINRTAVFAAAPMSLNEFVALAEPDGMLTQIIFPVPGTISSVLISVGSITDAGGKVIKSTKVKVSIVTGTVSQGVEVSVNSDRISISSVAIPVEQGSIGSIELSDPTVIIRNMAICVILDIQPTQNMKQVMLLSDVVDRVVTSDNQILADVEVVK